MNTTKPISMPGQGEAEADGAAAPLTITASEARLLAEAVEFLLSATEKEEHLAHPLHALETKLARAAGEVRAVEISP